jgi:hypothetical protein
MKNSLRSHLTYILLFASIINIGYASQLTLSITSVSVSAGTLFGGTSVTLIGTGFLEGATIYFEDTACSKPIVKNNTEMSCITPSHSAGVVSITVKNLNSQEVKLADAYTYQPAPTIDLVKSKDGSIPGETLISVTGTGFLEGAKVQINKEICTFPSIINNSEITCKFFDRTDIPLNLIVTNTDGQIGSINQKKIIPTVDTDKKTAVKHEFVENKIINLTLFYTASKGFFREQKKSILGKSNQDSPITLGSSAVGVINSDYSYDSSLYIAKLDSLNSSFDTEIDIPWEYGLTLYINYTGKNNKFFPYIGSTVDYSTGSYKYRLYAGFDYESFSTYNINEIATNNISNLSSIKHNLVYATFGITQTANIFGRNFFMKNSLSRTFYTRSSPKDNLTNEVINGYKLMFFLSTNIYDKISAHLLYKQHFMSGPTDLDIKRIGLGFSYKL